MSLFLDLTAIICDYIRDHLMPLWHKITTVIHYFLWFLWVRNSNWSKWGDVSLSHNVKEPVDIHEARAWSHCVSGS